MAIYSADKRTTFMCQLSSNLGASTSYNPQGLSRLVHGLLYLYLYHVCVCVFVCVYLATWVAKVWTVRFSNTCDGKNFPTAPWAQAASLNWAPGLFLGNQAIRALR